MEGFPMRKISAVSSDSILLCLNRIVIIRMKQACSTRDEIEAPASLEFIALYVERSLLYST